MVKDWTSTAVYYRYDGRGLITRVHAPAGWTYYTFDARGAVTKRELPNGTYTYYVYDAAGRTESIHDRQSDGTAICSFAFTRDDNGNILTSLREDDSCWYYAYDGLQRLTEAEWKDSTGTSLYAFAYDYDKVGNRTHLLFNGTHTYYTYNEASELTVEEELGGDTVYYVYDGRGNQTERSVLGGDTLYFDYNSRDLITRIDSTEGGFTPNTFDYNALGQRISKADSTGLTYYVWDGLNITHEHDGSGTITRRYTHGHTPIHGVFSLIDVEDDQGDHFFYHLDQVGGVHRLTDDTETTDTTYEFSPFGRMLDETAGSAPSDFTFPGTYIKLPGLPELRLSPTRVYQSGSGAYQERDRDLPTPSYGAMRSQPAQVVDPSGRSHQALVVKALIAGTYLPWSPPRTLPIKYDGRQFVAHASFAALRAASKTSRPERILGFARPAVTKLKLKVEKKPDGKCWLLVKMIEWHTEMHSVSQQTWQRVEGPWRWKDYERNRGRSKADWYYKVRFTTYWATRTHEQEHARQYEEAARVALPKFIATIEMGYPRLSEAEFNKRLYEDFVKFPRLQIYVEHRKMFPVRGGFKAGDHGEFEAVTAELKFLEREYKKVKGQGGKP